MNVKNVFFAIYEEKQVVLKKLAHNSELRRNIDKLTKNDTTKDILDFLIDDTDTRHFKICDYNSAILFLKLLSYRNFLNIQTMIKLNVEPILLDIFNSRDGWCVPKLYGFCGRLVVVENAGQSLVHVKNFSWFDRAYLAYQILQAAKKFYRQSSTFQALFN
ncbi:hypothetical protein NQ314_021256 [Rhamnusium bicolor]|uniref:FAM69 protein-kinase domain-containing protein n=1 Tax=Rhamnusium bicolor TaxID=1586634 RepID=A0AAV8WJL2_9CUCU|nr:hypothetical protein NQ314_021256 [Rhamnusium bicolor]